MSEPNTLVVTNSGYPVCWNGENWTILEIPVGPAVEASIKHWAKLPLITPTTFECTDCRVLRKEVEELRAYKFENEQLIV